MALCRCKNAQCACRFVGGFGIEVSGLGSDRQPYSAETIPWDLVGSLSSSAEVIVTGSGTGIDPWVVSIESTGASVSQTIFTATGSWVKPAVGTVCFVQVVGGGGGGGRTEHAASAWGASGGAGGAMSTGWFLAEDLPDSVSVVVGNGGAGALIGGPSATGGAGGASSFGNYLLADGGVGGTNQSLGAVASAITAGGTAPEGGPGGAGSYRGFPSDVPATDHSLIHAPTGGGMGDGNSVAWTGPGSIGASVLRAGMGGDGAHSVATPGSPGNLYGGGGGGGAAQSTSPLWSSGGSGAQGVVIVTTW